MDYFSTRIRLYSFLPHKHKVVIVFLFIRIKSKKIPKPNTDTICICILFPIFFLFVNRYVNKEKTET